MGRLLFLFVIAFLVFVGLRALLGKKNLSVKQFMAIYFASLLGVGLLFLGFTGKLHPLFAVAGAVLPFLLRSFQWITRGAQIASMFKFLQGVNLGATPGNTSGPKTSEIKTRYLEMILVHETGMMDGTVLEGGFEDAKLSELELDQLLKLLQEIGGDDDSYNLLIAYLDREHPEWKTSQQRPPPRSGGDMSEAEACEILGVQDGASDEDIVQAHRRLIQKVHPDRGGSDYLAAKINAAKDFLLQKSR